ncbi:hypothetical protein [Salinisphaera sp. Q1T1-3]|uniref:hypothetical protein n=1 Tax=Salinisphaera sp. Q1T1-3 TaxID=2321229 RepID=UPI0011C36FC1|nr:hypothetical protein [Salinisphaera sp. Q1T1-3]
MGIDDIQQVTNFEATGATRDIAGIAGRVYHIEWVDSDQTKHKDEAVLSDNPLVFEMFSALSYFSQVAGQYSDEPDALEQRLNAERLGILQLDGTKVIELAGEKPDESMFELPSKPASLTDMAKGMSAE